MEYEDRLRITTPEGVELELTLAGVGSRFIAAILDLTVQALVAGAGALLVFTILDGGIAIAIASTAGFLLFFGYDVAFEVLAAGRTPGKRWTGLRVVRESGSPVTFLTSATRNVVRLVDILPLFYAVGIATVLATRRNQRLGDLAAGTVIVRERHGDRRGAASPEPVPAPTATGWDTTAVTAEEIAIVRSFLARRWSLTASARAELGRDLASRLKAKTAGVPAGLTAEQFLEQLVAIRSR